MRIGGVFEEDADVDDGGADADLCESRYRRTTRQERQQLGRRACIVSQAETADGIILRGEEEREYSV